MKKSENIVLLKYLYKSKFFFCEITVKVQKSNIYQIKRLPIIFFLDLVFYISYGLTGLQALNGAAIYCIMLPKNTDPCFK